jgi:tripartite-type tricarboxylate transporter receptor subunit TctC
MFKMMAHVDMVHIPYKGAGRPSPTSLAARSVLQWSAFHRHRRTSTRDRLRALGVTSAKRFSGTPDIPTIAEAALPGFDTLQWWGLVAPRTTSADVVNKIAADVARLNAATEMKERLLTLGAEPVTSYTERSRFFVHDEIDKWGKLVRASGARPIDTTRYRRNDYDQRKSHQSSCGTRRKRSQGLSARYGRRISSAR